jgi:hypothetical protein
VGPSVPHVLFTPHAASWGREFTQRALLYRHWDRALCESTRFYAAAALINSAFAEILSTPAALLVSARTIEFFCMVSRALLASNAALAASLVRGNARGLPLDASIVHREQRIVEHHLAELHRRECRAHACLVREANGLLSLVQALAQLSTAFPNTTVLGTVLRQLRVSRGKLVNFADRGDREAVGNALIVSARRQSCGGL